MRTARFVGFLLSIGFVVCQARPTVDLTENCLETSPITATTATATDTVPTTTGSPRPPTTYGALVFPGMDMIDIWGPLDILQMVAQTQNLSLHLIGHTLDAVPAGAVDPSTVASGADFWPMITPTATIEDDLELDVLIVPGGPGARSGGVPEMVEYIRRTYPRLQHLITVCTGAALAARSGVLDGVRATTNKRAWATVTAFGPGVKWVSPARYTTDGNIWTSSGVASSLDLTYAFVKEIYGEELGTRIANTMEHSPLAPEDDIFAQIWDVPPTGN